MERDFIDYLSHAEGEYQPTSFNANLKELIQLCRYIRSQIPADQIQGNMPLLWKLEKKLQEDDAAIGIERIEYIQEIMNALDTEHPTRRFRRFVISEIYLDESQNVIQTNVTENRFPSHEQATDWILSAGINGLIYEVRELYYKY